MYRRQIIKDRIYYFIEKVTGEKSVDRQCGILVKLGIDKIRLHSLVQLIERDFKISLELQNNYVGVTTIDILCNLIEIEIFSKW